MHQHHTLARYVHYIPSWKLSPPPPHPTHLDLLQFLLLQNQGGMLLGRLTGRRPLDSMMMMNE